MTSEKFLKPELIMQEESEREKEAERWMFSRKIRIVFLDEI